MKVKVKGTTIIFSEKPKQNVSGALLLIYRRNIKKTDTELIIKNKQKAKLGEPKVDYAIEEKYLDAVKGQKKYDLPEGVTKKDIEALYLRIL